MQEISGLHDPVALQWDTLYLTGWMDLITPPYAVEERKKRWRKLNPQPSVFGTYPKSYSEMRWIHTPTH